METKQHATKNQWVNEEIKKEIKKYLKTNDNEDITTQNLCSAQREVHSNKAFLRKEENPQINNLTYQLKELKEQTKPKFSRRKEIIKAREEINSTEIQKTIEKKNQ